MSLLRRLTVSSDGPSAVCPRGHTWISFVKSMMKTGNRLYVCVSRSVGGHERVSQSKVSRCRSGSGRPRVLVELNRGLDVHSYGRATVSDV
jgi:hypothetical protein